MTRFSTYLTMRDGVRIAIDVHIPDGEGPFPTVVHQTRYFRSVTIGRKLFKRLQPHLDQVRHTRKCFNKAGYVWINADVRGSGASTGSRPCPWSPDETADGGELVDWIVAQPWSTGLVGATGISYGGTTAEMLLINKHPAVRAIAPRFSLFDVYTDVMAPGGVPLKWFIQTWNQVNQAFDRDQYDLLLALIARVVVQSAASGSADARMPNWTRHLHRLDRPGLETTVKTLARRLRAGVRIPDEDRAALDAAVLAHMDNYDVHESAEKIVFRDDTTEGTEHYDHLDSWSRTPGSSGRFSPHSYQEEIRASGAAIFSISGWLDGAYQHAAIKRHLTTGNAGDRLMIGPWEHGGHLHISPHAKTRTSGFDHETELIAFFDHHLKGLPAPDVAPVRYYTMGAEVWRDAPTWPPPGTTPQPLFLAPNGALSPMAPKDAAAADAHRLPTDATTGHSSRWRSFIGPHTFIGYPDRTRQTQNLPSYTTAPLSEDLEVTGHPLIHLHLTTEVEDGDLFVYLEEVREGQVTYITEGMLRLIHRAPHQGPAPYQSPAPFRAANRATASPMTPGEPGEVVFDLLPVSYMLRRGSALRISLAGSDTGNFGAPKPLGGVKIHRSAERPSHIVLPLAKGRVKD